MKSVLRLSYVLVTLLVVLLLVNLVVQTWSLREPTYEGKSLSAWLRKFEEAKVNSPTSPYHLSPTEFQVQFVEPTEAAVRHMGTNALPRLLVLLRAHDSTLQQKAAVMLPKLPFVRWRPPSPELRRSMALTGFRALGTNAQPAVPALVALLDDRDGEIRKYAAWCLGSVGPSAGQAVPCLLQHLADPDPVVRDAAENSLGLIHQRPELVVPVLKDRLAVAERKWPTLFALGCFGPEAKAAVPSILPLLDDLDRETKTWAAVSLRRIDPEAADKAQVNSP